MAAPSVSPKRELAKIIIGDFKKAGFSDIIFDFDGTLLNGHSYFGGGVIGEGYKGMASSLRAEHHDPEVLKRWFADFELLKEIAAESKTDASHPINFHIVSNQDSALIHEILDRVGIRDCFTAIYGKGAGNKRPTVEAIAAHCSGKVFFVDDDHKEIGAFEDYEDDKIVCVGERILNRFNERKATAEVWGLTEEKWTRVGEQVRAIHASKVAPAPDVAGAVAAGFGKIDHGLGGGDR